MQRNKPVERQSPVTIPGTQLSANEALQVEVKATSPTQSTPVGPNTSLIDSYSTRRRSLIGSNKPESANHPHIQDSARSDTLFEELSSNEIQDRYESEEFLKFFCLMSVNLVL